MDLEVVAAAALYLGATYKYYLAVHRHHAAYRKKLRRRRCWMKAIHHERTRASLNNRLDELLTELTGEYFIHMSATDFEYLLQKISPIIKKQDTCWRDSIPPKIRLAVTLRYLATGDSYTTLHQFFKVSVSLISRIIPEVCKAFSVVLNDLIRLPSSPEAWLQKSKGFSFPHCLGALDGKHIPIWSPSHTNPEDINYFGNYSMVLLSLVDSDFTFMYADVAQSQNTDCKVFKESDLWLNMNTDNLNLPPYESLPGESDIVPYIFVSNGVFALERHVMKPYVGHFSTDTPESVFNHLMAQSHTVLDNAFGVISTVFKVLHKPIVLEPSKCALIIRSCLLLHNFLIKSDLSRDTYCPPGLVDTCIDGELVTQGSWRYKDQEYFQPLQTLLCDPDIEAISIRQHFLDHISRNALIIN